MPRCSNLLLYLLLLLLSLLVERTSSAKELYGILGVRRDCTDVEVKRAYKRLAMKWHPDHNRSPEAKDKFIEIQQAYDILSDPAKRRDYDIHGWTPEEKAQRRSAGPRASPFMYGGPHSDFFGQWFTPPITSDTTELQNSNWHRLVRQPPAGPQAPSGAWLVHFYNVHSPLCHQLSPLWEETAKAVRSLVAVGRVNAEFEPGLCRQYGVSIVPAFLLLMANGSQWTAYDGPLTLGALVGFVTFTVAHGVETIHSEASLAHWLRLRPHSVKAVLFADKEFIPPLFAAVGYGFIPLMDLAVIPRTSAVVLRRTHGVSALPALVFFKGGDDVVRLSVAGVHKARLTDILRQHRLPRIPPLTSLSFSHICGADASTDQADHCAVLVAQPSSPGFQDHIAALRTVMDSGEWPAVRFAWLDASEQQAFLACYAPIKPVDPPTLLVLSIGGPPRYTYATPTTMSPAALRPVMASIFRPSWQWQRPACRRDPPLRVPAQHWGWDDSTWWLRRTAEHWWTGPWHLPGAEFVQYVLLPLLLIPLLWGRDTRSPQGETRRTAATDQPQPSPHSASPSPAHPPPPSQKPSPALPLLSPDVLDHPGYTVLVFADMKLFSSGNPVASAVARAVQNSAGEGIWRFCLVPRGPFQEWWSVFGGAEEDEKDAVPMLLAVRHRKHLFGRMPQTKPDLFPEALRNWMDLLAGGEGRLERTNAWPPPCLSL
eukprot:GGOE01056528.1.p1 GENE.GGOE01056528.1~~GGOE01056528.1.p1  ORF type:complete len:711 (+),score=131.50 GGOE01056528.1:115-2247(+)